MQVNLVPTLQKSAAGNCFFKDAVTVAFEIKSAPASLYLLDLVNSAAATSYLQVFFKPLAQVTLGTTVADLVIKLPTNAVQPSKTVPFPVPVGTGGSGLTVAGTTSATGSTTVAIGVTAVYL